MINNCAVLASGIALELDPLDCICQQSGSAVQIEFLLYVVAVCVDGLAAEMQPLGYLLALQALPDEFKDLEFPIGQSVQREHVDFVLATDHFSQHLLGDLLTDVDISCEDCPQSVNDFGGDFGLGDVSFGPGAEDTLGVERLVVHREHHDLQVRPADLDVLYEVKTAALFQREIDDCNVRLGTLNCIQRPVDVFGLVANRQVVFLVDEGRQSLSHYLVIVDNEYPVDVFGGIF